MTRAIPDAARRIVREFEGLKLEAYVCPAGVLTIGYGHTGPEVQPGLKITKRQADLYLTEDLQRAARRLEARIGPVVSELTDNQYAALLSFVLNLGADPSWTIWKRLKARDFDSVPAQLIRFVYSGKTKLKGLVRRRNAEVALWSEDEPGSADEEVNSAALRFAETPPAPAEKPKNAPLATAVLTAGTTATVAVKTVSDAVEPFADKSPLVGQVVMVLATLGALAAGIMAFMVWLQRQQARR